MSEVPGLSGEAGSASSVTTTSKWLVKSSEIPRPVTTCPPGLAGQSNPAAPLSSAGLCMPPPEIKQPGALVYWSPRQTIMRFFLSRCSDAGQCRARTNASKLASGRTTIGSMFSRSEFYDCVVKDALRIVMLLCCFYCLWSSMCCGSFPSDTFNFMLCILSDPIFIFAKIHYVLLSCGIIDL